MNKQKIKVMQDQICIKTIYRKIWAEQIGNFNPIFCRYQKNRVLVYSENGDISDPFRRDEKYLNTLFIKAEKNKMSVSGEG